MPKTCAECKAPWVGEVRVWAADYRPSGKRKIVYSIVDRIPFCREHASKYVREVGGSTLLREGVHLLSQRLSSKMPKLPIRVDIRWKG